MGRRSRSRSRSRTPAAKATTRSPAKSKTTSIAISPILSPPDIDVDGLLETLNMPVLKPKQSLFLPLFHSLLILCISSGMISAILTVDMIYDFRVSNNQLLGRDDPEAFRLAFDYYYSILNAKFMSMKVVACASSILYSSHLSFTAANMLNDTNPKR